MNSKIIALHIILSLSFVSYQLKAQQKESAFEFEAALTSDFASDMFGGINQGSAYLGNIDLTITFDTDKANWWKGGTFFVYGLNNHGKSLSSLVGDLQVSDNIEAEANTRLYQFWYQQQLGNVSIIIGQHDLNSEFAVTEYGTTFLNSSFGIQPDISSNVPVSIFPLASFGSILKWNISPNFTFLAAAYDGDPGDEESNPNSLTWNLNSTEGAMTIYELQYTVSKDSITTGTYKIGVWHHTANTLTYAANPIEYNNNQGIYFIADQKIFSEAKDNNQGLGLFVQLGISPKDCNIIKSYAGVGLVYNGLVPSRDDDQVGIALGQATLNYDFQNVDMQLYPYKHEDVIEFTYQAIIGPHFYVQPDFQYIINPSGAVSINNALVGSIRVGIGF